MYGLQKGDGLTGIVLELVEGETLADMIVTAGRRRTRTGTLPLDEALAMARQIAEALEAAHKKGVVSRTLNSAPWGTRENARLARGSLADAITTLRQQLGKNIGVHGSPTLVEAMLQADLLDELRLEIYPVVAGTGSRLFQARQASKYLQLADSNITSNGVAILTYRPSNSSKTS